MAFWIYIYPNTTEFVGSIHACGKVYSMKLNMIMFVWDSCQSLVLPGFSTNKIEIFKSGVI